MIRVGVAGIGMMGQFHARAYSQVAGARTVAVADPDAARLAKGARVAGNIDDDRGDKVDLSAVRKFDDVHKMIDDAGIDMVDICLPTHLHVPAAIYAMRAGKDVIVEKPFGRTAAEARRATRVAVETGRTLMVAHCIRFWPEYLYAENLIRGGRYGKVVACTMWRLGTMPTWSSNGWMEREDQGGAVALDLQIHDLDAAAWLFGRPKAVSASGLVRPRVGVVHASTRLLYGDDGPTVTCEASWSMPSSYGFRSGFTLVLEKGALVCDGSAKETLRFFPAGRGKSRVPRLRSEDAYMGEIRYFVRCVRRGETPDRVPNDDAAFAVRMGEAVLRSVHTGRTVRL